MDYEAYEKYVKYVKEHIKEYLPESYQNADISINETIGVGNCLMSGLVIKRENENVFPRVKLSLFYEDYSKGMDIEESMKAIADTISESGAEEAMGNIHVEDFLDFNKVKDRILPRILNKDRNMGYIVDKPFKDMGDVVVTYNIDLGASDAGVMSSPVTHHMLENWIDTSNYLNALDRLDDIARENLEKREYTFMDIGDMIASMTGEDNEFGQVHAYVLTNEERLNGASMLLNRKAMGEISDKLGGDLIVIPSSVHETILLPASSDIEIEGLNGMISDVNNTVVSFEEMLGNHAFYYDSINGELLMDKRDPAISRMLEAVRNELGRSDAPIIIEIIPGNASIKVNPYNFAEKLEQAIGIEPHLDIRNQDKLGREISIDLTPDAIASIKGSNGALLYERPKTEPGNPLDVLKDVDEAFVRVGDYSIHVHESDEGVDYTIYKKNLLHVDGGIYDNRNDLDGVLQDVISDMTENGMIDGDYRENLDIVTDNEEIESLLGTACYVNAILEVNDSIGLANQFAELIRSSTDWKVDVVTSGKETSISFTDPGEKQLDLHIDNSKSIFIAMARINEELANSSPESMELRQSFADLCWATHLQERYMAFVENNQRSLTGATR